MVRPVIAVAALCATLIAVAGADAAPPPAGVPAATAGGRKVDRLAVLPIILAGPYGEASLSSVLDDITEAARFRAGLRLVSNEEMFVASSGGLGSRVRDCGSDSMCIADRLRAFDARLGLVVVVNLALDPPLLSLQLLDTDDRKKVGESLGELVAADGGISNALRSRARKLFEDGGYGQAGRIVVEVSPPGAKITIGEGAEPEEGATNVYLVPPGHYAIAATADGYSDGAGEAVVTSGQETKVALLLEKDSSIVKSPWFWTVIGVAVAGGAAAAILAATRTTTRCLCTQINGVGCEICNQ